MDADVNELRALLAKATPGPWSADYDRERLQIFICNPDDCLVMKSSWHSASKWFPTKDETLANAALIVAAVNAAPTLLDTIEAQAARIAELEAENDALARAAAHHRAAENAAMETAAALTATIETQAARIAELEAALAKAGNPKWFYDADGDMERACFDVGEVVESVLEWSEADEYHKPRLIEVATAKPLPSIWVIARAYTDEERAARSDDEPYEVHEFATQAEALSAFQGRADG